MNQFQTLMPIFFIRSYFSSRLLFSFVSFHEILKHFIHLRQKKTARVVLDTVISFINSGTDFFEATLKKFIEQNDLSYWAQSDSTVSNLSSTCCFTLLAAVRMHF